MTQLTLTADQTALLSVSDPSLLVCRPDGQVVGVLAKVTSGPDLKKVFSAEEIEAAEREMRETSTRRTTQQVLDRLATLGK